MKCKICSKDISNNTHYGLCRNCKESYRRFGNGLTIEEYKPIRLKKVKRVRKKVVTPYVVSERKKLLELFGKKPLVEKIEKSKELQIIELK